MKLNFITDQGSILASTSWARRVGAVVGALLGAGGGTGPATAVATVAAVAAARSAGGGGFTVGLNLDGLGRAGGLLRLELGLGQGGERRRATLAAIPGEGACGA